MQLRTWLNKSKIEDRFGNWHVLASFSLKWNNVFCSKWSCFIHYSLKKNPKTVSFWTTLCIFFFPWRAKAGEEGFSSTPMQRLSLPLIYPKNLDTTYTPSWPTTMMKEVKGTSPTGGFGATAHRPPQPPYLCAMTGQG